MRKSFCNSFFLSLVSLLILTIHSNAVASMSVNSNDSLLSKTIQSNLNYATTNEEQRDQSIASMEIREIEPLPLYFFAETITPVLPDFNSVIKVIDDLIAIGKKIWPIIEANRPVVTTDLKSVISVLPPLAQSERAFDHLDGWSIPEVRTFRIATKNYMGREVISFDFSVIYQHSGRFNGVGSYLTSTRVVANEIYAAWGFNFNASTELVNIANVGSKKDPVASAIFVLNYKTEGKFNKLEGTTTFYIDGKGNFKVLR
jgi:hypothetical protein